MKESLHSHKNGIPKFVGRKHLAKQSQKLYFYNVSLDNDRKYI